MVAATIQHKVAMSKDITSAHLSMRKYSVARYTIYGMSPNIPKSMVSFRSATVRRDPTI
jgi:hypothetical protein